MAQSQRYGRRVAIVDGVRTPFCKAGTEFKKLSSLELALAAVQQLVARTELDTSLVDAMVFGNVVPTMAAPNVAREVGLASNLPKSIPGVTVMRACASGSEATTQAANAIALGESEVAIVGGVECLSDIPVLFSRQFAEALVDASKAKSFQAKLKAFGKIRPKDLLPVPPAIAERATGMTMGQHAEAMAKLNGISRREQDELAFRSHQRAAAAQADGRFAQEIAPVMLMKEKRAVSADNHIRKDTSIEALSDLRPVFDKKYGSVTAGNACPVTDGASVLLLMSEEKAKALGYTPLGYIRSYAYTAVDPHWQLLIGPAFAMPKALDRAGLSLADMDLVDVHEAFAAQVLSNLKSLASTKFCQEHLGRSQAVGEVDPERLNVMGGSIAIGHPFAATACRQMTSVLNELKRRDKQFAIVSQCAAGGMGAAVVLERV